MKKKKIVYIVREGELSDSGIIAVFSTREKAEEFMKEYKFSAELEEYEVDLPKESLWCEKVVQIFSSSSGTYPYLKKE